MVALAERISDVPDVRFVSFDVDPEYDTPEVLAEWEKRAHPDLRAICYRPNRGKGCAVRTGMLAARGEVRMFAAAMQQRVRPVLAQIIPIRRCNLACSYCNEFDHSSQPVPLSEMLVRVDKLAALGVSVVTISGGEPLLHPQLENIIRRIRYHGAIATLISNAYLLSPQRIHALNDAGLDYLQISIDNVEPDDTSKKSLRVLERKLEWLAREAEFSVTINSVLGAPSARRRPHGRSPGPISRIPQPVASPDGSGQNGLFPNASSHPSDPPAQAGVFSFAHRPLPGKLVAVFPMRGTAAPERTSFTSARMDSVLVLATARPSASSLTIGTGHRTAIRHRQRMRAVLRHLLCPADGYAG
jgi:hypothetical protein